MCVHRQINCQQDNPAAFKDIALINTFPKSICVSMCVYLSFLTGSLTRKPSLSPLSAKHTCINPLQNRDCSVGLRSPQLHLVNQLKVYLHRHPFPHLFPWACQGTTDLGNRSRTNNFSFLISVLTFSCFCLLGNEQ